ncbi:30184_t:CDS:2 [Racocetra persica]|uniref:30184_t:CDS:1 n=1 Tax=Racocetra persica TaxID=160502 RepID=A0ACA9K9Q8_9GLOM|nr:30184_t:CDS:2 [Racocetra persica]
MTNKVYDSPNEVSRKNQNKASDISDVEQETWVNKAGQENEENKASKASKGSESSFEALSHNREETNNLDVISVKYPLARHLLCIWYIKENLKKALRRKLGNSFADFYSAFWKCRNAETPDAREFTMMLFTLEIESISFMENQNACIKHVLENNNTSLYELGKVMMNHVEERLKQKQYEAWICSIPSTSNTVTVFPTIEALIRCYLRPNIIQYLLNQIKESDKDLKDELDSISICAKFLLQQLDYSSIVEIWNISQITSHNINHIVFCLKNGAYCCICLLQQKKELIPKESHQDVVVEKNKENIKNKSPSFNWIQPFHDMNEQENNTNEGFVDELLFYGRVLHHDEKFIKIIKNYLANDDSNKENELMNVQLRNPRKVITRDRPKSVSHHNNETNRMNKNTMQELTTHRKRKRGPNLCSNCKKPGYNIAKCSKKDIEQTSEEKTEEETK